jgi:hypothetical protein
MFRIGPGMMGSFVRDDLHGGGVVWSTLPKFAFDCIEVRQGLLIGKA